MQISNLFPDNPHLETVIAIQNALYSGELKRPHKSLVEKIQRYPDAAVLHYLMSEVMIKLGRMDIALQAADKAIQCEPKERHFLAHMSYVLLQSVQIDQALRVARECWKLGVDHPITADVLGNTLTGCGELSEALEAYRTAVRLAPTSAHFQFNLATALRAVGKMEQAEQCYDSVIDARPQDWKAYQNRSDLRTQTLKHNHVVEMENLLSLAEKDPRGESALCSAIAKELSDLGDFKKSWRYLKRSADKRRSMIRYQVEGDVDVMQALADAFSPDLMGQNAGFDNEEPIFILGLPRTGSTLLERMLGSHSDVYAAGELQNFVAQFMRLVKTTFPNETIDKETLAQKSTGLNFKNLGEAYIKSTRPRTGKTRFFIDKMPLNFLYVGLIHLALPKAKIIHVTRHPMDTCYAIYKTSFDQTYPYSYDLLEMAKYYVAYRKLMDHWNSVLPNSICNIAYEDLVSDTEAQLNRVLTFCDLQYQPACSQFHKSKVPTNTASAAQVRQPIYTSSVEKWKRVKQELKPFQDYLESAGIGERS